MSIICQNPALFDGTIAIALYSIELGLEALAAYFENPAFLEIAVFIDSIASLYAQDAAYAGIQLMLSKDPSLSFIGGQMVQWAQAGASGTSGATAFGAATVPKSFVTAIYTLANATPKTQYLQLEQAGPENIAGTPSYIYRMAGFTQIPKSSNPKPVDFEFIPIPVPLDPQSYQNRYGFPPPSNNDLGAFLVSGVAPQFKNYSAAEINQIDWPQRAVSDLFNAYVTWQNFCGSQSKPPPPPPHKQPPPPPPPPPPPDGGGDELTDCCNTTAYYLGLIAAALQNLTFPQGTDSGCCDQVVNAIGGVAEQLKAITESLPGLKAAPSGSVDLTPIVDAFERLIGALTPVSVESPTINSTLQDRLTAISDAIAKGSPTDPNDAAAQLKRIADDEDKQTDSIAEIAAQGRVREFVIDSLVANGVIPPTLAQQLGGKVTGEDIISTIGHSLPWLFGPIGVAVAKHFKVDVAGDPTKLPSADDVIAGVAALVDLVVAKLKENAPTLSDKSRAAFTDIEGALGAPALAALEFVLGAVKGLGKIQPGSQDKPAGDTLVRAWLVGEVAHVLAMVAGNVDPLTARIFEGMAALVAQAAGFGDIVKAVHEPWYDAAFRTPTIYDANSKFRSHQPIAMLGQILYSRRIITEGQLRQILAWDGLAPEYEDAYVAGSFRPVNPRAIATAYQDVPFPRDQVQLMLEYGGARDADVHTLLDAFDFASIKNVRQQYLTSVIGAAERGNLTDADVAAALDSLQFSPTARNFVKLAIATRKLEQLDILYRKSVSEAYKFGLISDADYVPHMEAVGIAAADAEAHYAVDSIAKQGVQMRAAARAEARTESQIQRAAIQAAQLAFAKGQIDAIALAAELLAAGIDPRLAGLLTTIATLRKTARMVDVQGKLVTPNEAILLKDRITAIKDQVTKKAIDPSTGETMLLGLGIPIENVKALVAAWVATAYKTAQAIQ